MYYTHCYVPARGVASAYIRHVVCVFLTATTFGVAKFDRRTGGSVP